MGFKARQPRKKISSFLQNAAQATLGTSIAGAIARGQRVSATQCDRCDEKAGAPQTICPLCALALDYQPKSSAESEVVAERLLLVPGEWLVDFMRGFELGKRAQEYPGALRVGRKLRKKFVGAPVTRKKAA